MNKKILTLILLQVCIGLMYAQVGIGTHEISPSAMLEVKSSNKGVIFPRIALNSNTDKITIPNPSTGLTIYNTGLGDFKITGYMSWDGTMWVKLQSEDIQAPGVSGIQCTGASMTPSIFKAGVPYEGIMEIPYVGGNGASYPAGTAIASTGNTGLTATLQAGILQQGNGVLRYTLSGTPLLDSPATAYFNINVLGNTCTAGVSGSLVLEIGSFITFSGIFNTTGFAGNSQILLSSQFPDQLPVIDGLRMDLAYYDPTFYFPRIYNVSSQPQLISLQTFATEVNQNRTALNQTITTGGFIQVDIDNTVYWTTVYAEVITSNVQVQVSPGVWRWYEMKWWAMQTDAQNNYSKTIFMSVTRKA
ncbi:hypothetical protein CLV62_11751 [Dysgonomonas alginatilytica]|uniref:Uncharacterized protein n=1 Tax=Dysgonomonas alginatilytica TaxID=1605892 RepID=A0A2V3PM17_9BACT|nr:hypothetical protein [Dysgonomonas alginatilytica]PXV62835.1 hypothetical protein CLV62_11751 [Dysgonomonas alginatilytica]